MDRLTRERDEALEQQAAISDILRVISNSPSGVQPVLDAVSILLGLSALASDKSIQISEIALY